MNMIKNKKGEMMTTDNKSKQVEQYIFENGEVLRKDIIDRLGIPSNSLSKY